MTPTSRSHRMLHTAKSQNSELCIRAWSGLLPPLLRQQVNRVKLACDFLKLPVRDGVQNPVQSPMARWLAKQNTQVMKKQAQAELQPAAGGRANSPGACPAPDAGLHFPRTAAAVCACRAPTCATSRWMCCAMVRTWSVEALEPESLRQSLAQEHKIAAIQYG